MWTDTVNRVLAERIDELEFKLSGLECDAKNDAFRVSEAERELRAARAALAAMTQERDDWKQAANEETRSAERMIAELTAERDTLRAHRDQHNAELDQAGKEIASMRAERDAAQEACRLAQNEDRAWQRQCAEAVATNDSVRAKLAECRRERDALQAELLHRPGGMTVQPLREWTAGTMTGQVCAEAGSVVLHLRDHVGGMVVALSIPQALGVMAAIEACADEAAGMQGEDHAKG